MKPVHLSIQHMIADAVRFLRQCQRDHLGQSTNFYYYSNLYTICLCMTQICALSDTDVSFPSRKWHHPEEQLRGACLHRLPSRY